MTKETRAQKSARNKAERAAQIAARDALAEHNRLERAARDAQARADGRALAIQLVPLDVAIKSGNELRALARTLTPLMVQRLVETALGDGKEAVNAIGQLLDRGWGKPVQPVAALPGEVFLDMEEEQLDAYLMTNTTKYIEGELANVRDKPPSDDTKPRNAPSPRNAPAEPRAGEGKGDVRRRSGRKAGEATKGA